MPPDRAERVAELVAGALERPAAERAAFLAAECGGDATLRAEVESLLRFTSAASDFIERPAYVLDAEALAASGPVGSLAPGAELGAFKVVSLLGEGGMGEVYLAEDRELGRTVALKLVKRGVSAAGFRQFLREERILAALNDPNIARLYGGAVAPDGQPYFVMEYVAGRDLDEHCRAEKLPLRARLELFRKVCAAVSHAHQQLVIHRDLKPANIRVTAGGEPKLLDFGIAKVLDPAADARADATATLAPAMTPAYASPEQLRGERITTAADIYSLGVVLYELLAGRRPCETRGRSPEEAARLIARQEPPRPSAVAPAARRQLAGDLDNIALRALRPEPERRYASAAELGEDIRRHLEGRPVLARKETLRYFAAKFIRRHRLGVAAAALVLLALLAGVAAAAWSARVARDERAKAVSVSAFLREMLNHSNPLESGRNARETTVAEMLDAAARRLETERATIPAEIRAELLYIIAECYSVQGRYDLWDKYIGEYVESQAALKGLSHVQALGVAAARGRLLFSQGRLAEAERDFREVLPLLRAAMLRGEVRAEALANALNNFAYLRRTQGDSAGAEAAFRETLALAPKLAREFRYFIGMTRSTLASVLADGGRFPEALASAREAVAEYRETQATGTPDYGFSLTVLGGFLLDQGELAAADEALREGETILRRRLSPTHLWLGDNLRNQALLLNEEERFAEAEAKAREAQQIYLTSFGPHYDHYPTTRIALGVALGRTGRVAEGEAMIREALEQRAATLPPEHFWIALARGALGECLARQGRIAEAGPLLAESHAALAARLGPADPRTRKAEHRLGRLRAEAPASR